MSNRYVQTDVKHWHQLTLPCLCGICMNKSDAGMGCVKTQHQEVSWMTVYILCNWDYPWVCDGLVCKMPISGNVFVLMPCPIIFLFYSGCLVELRRQELKDSLHHAAKCFISACANIGLKRSASCITIETYWNALKATPGKFCIWTKEAHQRRTPLNVFRISLS